MAHGSRFDQIDDSWRHGAGVYAQSADGSGTNGHLGKFNAGVLIDNGSALSYAADTGTANAYAAALTPALTAGAGDIIILKIAHTNTGASTLSLNGGSAIAIKKKDGITDLASGDWTAGQIVELIFDGTNWQWIGGAGSTLALQTNGSSNGVQTLLDLVAGTGITLSNSGGHTTIAGTAATGAAGAYNINFGIVGQPAGGSVVLAFHVFTEAVNFAANFSGSRGVVPVGGANPTTAQTWTVNKILSGSSTVTAVGTVAISTAGVVSFASSSGATVSFGAGDTTTLVGSATADATLSYVDVVFAGLRAVVTSTPIGVIAFSWLGTVPASQILGMYEFVNGMTFPANFSGAAYGKVITNGTGTWTATIQKNGSTVGTISVSTSGVFTFTSSGGTTVFFATGDLMTVVAQSSADSTFAYVTVSFSGSANGYVILGGDLGGTATAPKVIGLQGVGISATAPTNGQTLAYNSSTALWTPGAAASSSGGVSAKTANYTAVSGDSGKLITFTSATAVTLTLPASPPASTWYVDVENVGAGTLTVSRNSLTIDGASTDLSLTQNQGARIFTDGTNYFTQRGVGGSGTTNYWGQGTATAASGNNQVTLGSTPLTNSLKLFSAGLLVSPSTYSLAGAIATLSSGSFTAGNLVDAYWVTANSTPGGITVSSSSITLRATSSQTVNTTTIAVTWPTGTVAGDLVVIFVSGQNNLTSPSGWAVLQNAGTAANWNNGGTFSKVMTSGDISTGSVTITTSGTGGIVACVASFVGSPTVRETVTGWANAGPATASVTTSGSVISTDFALYFGSARASANPTCNIGTMRQQVNNGTAAAGALYTQAISASGAITATFSYSGYNPQGHYESVVVLKL